MPVPPMGFFPSGSISTGRAFSSLELACPLVVAFPYGCCFCFPDANWSPEVLTFRAPGSFLLKQRVIFNYRTARSTSGLCSLPVSVSPAQLLRTMRETVTLLGFLLLRDFSLPAGGFSQEPNPLMSLPFHKLRSGALQSISFRKIGLTLSSLPPLPRFATLSTEPESLQIRPFGVTPQGPSRVSPLWYPF
jgi:hypothetical protein